MAFSRRAILLSFSTLTLAAAAGCSPAKKGGGTTRVLTATTGYPEPHTLFAPGGGGGGPAFTGSKVLERLLRYNKDQTFSGVLATDWKIGLDGSEIDLNLRPGVTWHDGQPLTPDDVAWTVVNYWKPFYPQSILDFLAGVDVTGPASVKIRFSRPVPEFSLLTLLSDSANYILPKHLYDGTDVLLNPHNAAPVGTGPWKFSQWVRGSYVEFVRNPAYWQGGKPKLDKLIIRWFREPASRAAALSTGEVDIGVYNPVPLNDVKDFQAKANVSFEDTGGAVSVYFNVKNPIYSDVRVRQALVHAIDRDFITRTIYFGLARPAFSPILTSNKLYFTDDVPKYSFDPGLAASLLDAAGYPVKADGTRFTMNLLASGWSEENGKVGAYLKQVFGDLKIDVTLRVPDRPNSLKALYTDYDFDLAYSQGGGAENDPVPLLSLLFTTAGIRKGLVFRNASRYATPVMDKLVESITVETDPVKRKALIGQFAKIVMTDLPVFPVVEWPTATVALRNVHIDSTAAAIAVDSWADAWKG